ncbi:MAG: DNA repair protein RecN [Rhodospirillaceae bacterium]|nr:DNA repair protein RecN [Rhodospirillaceae bacterium]
MLTELSIRDVVTVDKLDIGFASGLTVLTGETGAGKSIVLDALGLALGGRADAALIRKGADKLAVSAAFTLPRKHPAFGILAAQDLGAEDDAIVLRRTLSADGRSKAFINDQPVTVSLLRGLGALLVEVHGQFETHGLLDPATHMDALDAFRAAGKPSAAPDSACREAWSAWRAAASALKSAQDLLAAAQNEEETLRHHAAELDTLAPQPGEEQELAAARAVMRHGEAITKALSEARAAVSDAADVENALRTAVARINRVAAQAGGRLDTLVQAFDRAAIEASEALRELDRAESDLDADPAALERAEERLFALKAAARKHGCAVDDLAALRDTIKAKIAALDTGAGDIKKLASAEKATRMAYEQAAGVLSKARIAAAREFDKQMARELAPLKLDKATFRTVVGAKPEAAWNEHGIDRVAFEIATNPGTPPGPLNKIASGGELARFMLALKVVLAGTQDRAALIFDEVDAGVSGATANAVGERLARLARDVQVLVVTHAPQVAARGDHHWRVSKASRAGQTTTKVEELDAAARREEIARMLAGEKVTDEARAAATKLMSAAS